ncbi:hypothetical protein ABZZ47_14450 [Streptomyces sp. NPDC006465]|uniref:hypothetical protein n=1 Tax=Streptomyces sp. NPDC006465 TaxID=3157174 RepID=UPI0033B16AC5
MNDVEEPGRDLRPRNPPEARLPYGQPHRLFASSEFSDADPRTGMLRARGARLGQWRQFYPEYLSDAPPSGSPQGSVVVALGAKEAETDTAVKYVSADLSASGDGLLRSRASKIGSWEKFVLEPIANEEGAADEWEVPPAVAAAPADKVDVMTWNVCANAKQCTWSGGLAGYEELTDGIQARLRNAGNNEMPDVIFFQEFCEKHAKRVEWMLEKPVLEGGTGRGWDVRFAPIRQQGDSGPLVQKQCSVTDKNGRPVADRGAYGVAIAVPDTNTWYKRYDLPSPSYEKRTAVCAVMPAQAPRRLLGAPQLGLQGRRSRRDEPHQAGTEARRDHQDVRGPGLPGRLRG